MSFAQSIDYVAVAPALVTAGTAAGVLVLDLFVPRHQRWIATPISVLGMLGAFAASVALAVGPDRGTFCVGSSCTYVVDDFTRFFSVLFTLVAVVVLLLALPVVDDSRLPTGEFHFLLLTSFAGMLVISAARDLLLLLLALEVVSLPGFVLAGFRRSDPRSSESALKFFLFSVLSTAVMLYGMSLVYGVTGATQLDRIAAALREPRTHLPVTSAAIALTLVGFAFKVSAAPFHFWAPDTYEGAPVPVAAFLSVASKAAGFAGLLAVLVVGFRPYAHEWGPLVAVLAALTMTLGNLVALRQRHVVRLLAWSSIAQAGYMLVPLGVAATARGRADLGPATGATLGYLAAYAVMNLGAFACVVAVGRRRPRNSLEDYRGLFASHPLLALAFAFFLTALAGLPPGVIGLVAKVVVFRAAIDAQLVWLAVVMAVNTVVALYYYVRWAAVLFDVDGPPRRAFAVPGALRAAIAVTVLGAVVLGVYPQLVLHAVPGLR